jgi:hypothetical protein
MLQQQVPGKVVCLNLRFIREDDISIGHDISKEYVELKVETLHNLSPPESETTGFLGC